VDIYLPGSLDPAEIGFSHPDGQLPIGALLVAAGKIAPQSVERILRLQSKSGVRFGELAIKLRLATQADVAQALASQFGYPCYRLGAEKPGAELVAALHPNSGQVEALRALRTQLLLRWFTAERKMLAIVSAGRGEGRSYLTANLAILFAQMGRRTLLIDADLRLPRQDKLFSSPERRGLSDLLAQRVGLEIIVRLSAFGDLALLPAGTVPPNPQELLCRPVFPLLLRHLSRSFDVILFDTPACKKQADAETIGALAGGALILARKDASRMADVHDLQRRLQRADTTIAGAVLNRL
jgi:protein-tyrosine kinase